MNAIEVQNLHKRYAKVDALRGMSFDVPEGSLCGLIGLNGAGKTTTLRILLGMAKADSGGALIFGRNALNTDENRDLRNRIAYIPEKKELFPSMTGNDVIRFVSGFYPKWDSAYAADLARRFDLPLDRSSCKLSKGTLTKLHMLLALARGVDLLILDEPTDGLDAISSEEALRQLATVVADRGTTVLICSHRIEEIEQIADHLCLVHQGACLANGALDDLRAATRRIDFALDASPGQIARLRTLGQVRREGNSIRVFTTSNAPAILDLAREYGAAGIEATPVPLRDTFIELVRGNNGERS